MGLMSEFRTFVQRGNVIDMAVGVVMGGAFGKIISSLVEDVLMPPLGQLLGKVNFKDLKIAIGGAADKPITMNYGNFVQTVIDFLIVGFCIFLLVKAVNALKKPAAPAKPAEAPPEVQLLTEIRDTLKARA